MGNSNYPIKDLKAHHFTADYAHELDFKSFPSLLRRIADWIAANGLHDDEIDDIKFATTFSGASGNFDDDYYETATLYYRVAEEEK